MADNAPKWFPREILDAVISHMNNDHLADSLAIVRVVGQTPDASAVVLSDLGVDGAHFEATLSDGSTASVLIPWSQTPVERADIRHELVAWTEQSTSS